MGNYSINGIDVSRYQGDIDWAAIQQPVHPLPGPVRFAYVKATQGVGYIDPNAQTNAEGVKNAGLRLGYYHFATLNNNINPAGDAKGEAEAFLAALQKLPKYDIPPVLDIESNPSKLTPQQVLEWINSFYDTLKAGGVTDYFIYSYKYFLDDNLPANHGLGNVPLWLANYSNVQAPPLPNGWSNYVIWQYSNQGSFKGKNGAPVPCDLNKAVDTFLGAEGVSA